MALPHQVPFKEDDLSVMGDLKQISAIARGILSLVGIVVLAEAPREVGWVVDYHGVPFMRLSSSLPEIIHERGIMRIGCQNEVAHKRFVIVVVTAIREE